VTNFFRDREAFAALEKKIIPKLFEGKGAGDHVRVWVAGCATGEEAYSVAMLLCEYAGGLNNAPDLQVFATDIDEQAVATARNGFYTLNDAADERRHIRKDGSRFYVSGVMTSLKESEQLTGYAKIARDLTARHQLEEESRRTRDELELRVRERTHELAEANESLRREIAQRSRIEKERVRLLRQLVRTQEDERRRIARDIHDHLGQQSTALRLKLESLRERCAKYAELCELIAQTQEVARRLDADVDFLAWELRPAALDDLGLTRALANFGQEWSKHFQIPLEYHTTGLDGERLSPEAETNLYRIAQEALNNVIKHAQASRVDMLLERRDSALVLIIEDDGVGFTSNIEEEKSGIDRGLGLVGMRERAALIGGTLEIESTPDLGTTVFARIPISSDGEAAI
jgi:signal transduction histidine kinase